MEASTLVFKTCIGLASAALTGAMTGCVVSTPRGEVGLTAGFGETGDEAPPSPTTGITSTGPSEESSSGPDPDADGESGALDEGGILFDVGTQPDGGPPIDPEGGQGCDKVDFLFVVDNSGSMQDEQDSLTASFPGFIQAIQDTVAEDYHVMVIDTDAAAAWGSCQVSAFNNNCTNWCMTQCPAGCSCTCNNSMCPAPPIDECDDELGAGRVGDSAYEPCGVDSGYRWMTHTQNDLTGTFECVAAVGTVGDGNERPMDAMIEAITTHNPAGQCNEGFLRDDAILVITVITDEEDIGKSGGDPTSWAQALIDAKYGDETAVVPLALVGDTDLPNATCPDYASGGAEGSPRLRQWAESFTHGKWASVCAPDYTDFFIEAVNVIDVACTEFDPPG